MAFTNNSIKKISVVIPCYNEGVAIKEVINSFRQHVPTAKIYVFDNNSSDNTISQAQSAGAKIYPVRKQGKGHVIQAMFRDIDSDIYIMVDGDGTYLASEVEKLIAALEASNADMAVGNRLDSYHSSGSPIGHQAGNKIITKTVNYLFDSDLQDILSGYRILTNRFVKSMPLFSTGFEVETALSIHAIETDIKVIEVPIHYAKRYEGSESKLNTFRDGFKISWTILKLFKDHRPMVVYGLLSLCFFTVSLLIGVPIIFEYFDIGLVPRFPSAILAGLLMVICFLTLFSGIIISSISKVRREIKKLAFLSLVRNE